MVKLLFLSLLLSPITLIAQLKHDANWIFGYNCGLNFDSVATPFAVGSAIFNYCTTLSDETGLLQLYSSSNGFSSTRFSENTIQNATNTIIINGDSIWSYINGAKALIAFPNKVVFVSSSYKTENQLNCPGSILCINLAYSIIEKDVNGWVVTKKNIDISTPKPIDGRLAIIKHANGKDWWLLNHEGFSGDNFGRPPTNNYYRFLVSNDTIIGPEIQKIGFGHHDLNHTFGDIAISQSGNLVAFSITYAGIIELYDFDRCTGLFSNLRKITSPNAPIRHRYYGIEFSPSEKFLYVSTGRGYEPNSLYQLDLTQSNISASAQRLWYIQDIDTIRVGLLRLAPDGKIYLSSYVNDTTLGIHYKLGVIHAPDSFGVSSNFVPLELELDANCRTWYGLPQIPNYNLNGIPVHLADAGSNTHFCQGDSAIKGVTIGGDSIQGVIYEWLPAPGIDSLNATSQVVKPDSSRWYYVTITDTNYTGTYSCYSRLDSVYVEVKNCTDTTNMIDTNHVGISEPNFSFAVYPNPANHSISVKTNLPLTNLAIYSITGNLIYNYQAPNIPTLKDISGLENGVYLISGQTIDGKRQFVRFVKMNVAN